MSDGLRRRLEEVEIPGAAGAQERAWAAVRRAAGRRARSRRRALRAPAVAFATLALVAAVAAPSGPALAGWVKRVLAIPAPAPAPAPRAPLGPLPGGRLLVTSPAGTWTVARDGTRLRLGPWEGATWSPRGLFAAVWRGREIAAVAPDGRVAWRFVAGGPVHDAAWSPDGLRVAYRRGVGLAVVEGDGAPARLLAARVRPVAPAWRPGAAGTLAWVAPDGRVVVREVAGGRLVWRSPGPVGAPRALAWSADGRALLAVTARVVRVLDVGGGRVATVRIARGRSAVAGAWAPAGERFSLLVRDHRARSAEVMIATRRAPARLRRLFAVTGSLGSPAWAPDERRLLVRWREPDQWLLLRTSGPVRPTAIARVAGRFGGPPTVRGWCCAAPRRG